MSIQRKTPLLIVGGPTLAGMGTPNFWPATCVNGIKLEVAAEGVAQPEPQLIYNNTLRQAIQEKRNAIMSNINENLKIPDDGYESDREFFETCSEPKPVNGSTVFKVTQTAGPLRDLDFALKCNCKPTDPGELKELHFCHRNTLSYTGSAGKDMEGLMKKSLETYPDVQVCFPKILKVGLLHGGEDNSEYYEYILSEYVPGFNHVEDFGDLGSRGESAAAERKWKLDMLNRSIKMASDFGFDFCKKRSHGGDIEGESLKWGMNLISRLVL